MRLLGKILSLKHAVQKIKNNTLKGNAFSITFDDGYLDNFKAAEFLTEHNIPATFYVPFQQIDNGSIYWWDHVYSLIQKDRLKFHDWLITQNVPLPNSHPELTDRYARNIVQIFNNASDDNRQKILLNMSKDLGQYAGPRLLMNWQELKALRDRGFEIGSHTISHTPLTDINAVMAEEEILKSKELISQKIESEIDGFCYPRGAFSDEHIKMVRQSGYKYAVSTQFGSNRTGQNLFCLKRRDVCDYLDFRKTFGSLFFLIELSGVMDPILIKRRIG